MSSIAEKLLMIAENEPRVFEAGKAEGYAQGETAERNAFWEANQRGGKRESYNYAYAYEGFDDSNFNPIYPIAPTGSNGISNMCYSNKSFRDTKVNIIVTNASARQAFKYCSGLRRVPYIEFNNCTDFYHIFEQCNYLSYIRVGGEIDKSIYFKNCPLDLESAISVIEHLKNFRDIEEFAYTVTFSDSTWELLDADGIKEHQGAIEGTWREYLTYICWNF